MDPEQRFMLPAHPSQKRRFPLIHRSGHRGSIGRDDDAKLGPRSIRFLEPESDAKGFT